MEAKHHILEVVEVGRRRRRRRGVVTAVIDRGGGIFQYVVKAQPGDTQLDRVLWDEEELQPTGLMADPTPFIKVGDFHIRDVVAVSVTHANDRIRGQTGVIHASLGREEVLVWFEELGEAFALSIDELHNTGRRLPPGSLRGSASTTFSHDGEAMGSDTSTFIEDIEELDL